MRSWRRPAARRAGSRLRVADAIRVEKSGAERQPRLEERGALVRRALEEIRSLRAAPGAHRAGEREERVGAVGVELHGGPQVGDGIVVLSLALEHAPELEEGLYRRRLEDPWRREATSRRGPHRVAVSTPVPRTALLRSQRGSLASASAGLVERLGRALPDELAPPRGTRAPGHRPPPFQAGTPCPCRRRLPGSTRGGRTPGVHAPSRPRGRPRARRWRAPGAAPSRPPSSVPARRKAFPSDESGARVSRRGRRRRTQRGELRLLGSGARADRRQRHEDAGRACCERGDSHA